MILPALRRPPCLVTFSGGRDSSAILAIAAHVARREGLALPVPFTRRFAGAPYADETWWQERVIEHLGLRDWHRFEVAAGASDWIGPAARRALLTHGLLYPPNAFGHSAAFEAAAAGTVMTGVGGDDLLAAWRRNALAALLRRERRPEPYDVLRVGHAIAPAVVRRARAARTAPATPWLTPTASRAVRRARSDQAAREPIRWDAWLARTAAGRYIALMRDALHRLAENADATVVLPLLAPSFIASLARAGGARGLGDRTEVMAHLVGDLLPDFVLERRDKAAFHEVYWGQHSREFIDAWDGGRVDPTVVDAGRLREEWAKPFPNPLTALLLQATWLESLRRERT